MLINPTKQAQERQKRPWEDPSWHHYQLIIAYEGTHFFGWQEHSALPTIEKALQAAMQKIHHAPLVLLAASRTDAGVHARGQCIKCSSSQPLLPLLEKEVSPKEHAMRLHKLLASLNALTPSSITIDQLRPISASFHPSEDAKQKHYRYSIGLCGDPHKQKRARPDPLRRAFEWQVPCYLEQLQLSQVDAWIPSLLQQEDFSALTNRPPCGKPSSPQRRLNRITYQLQEQQLIFDLYGPSFSYKMVRNIVGTLLHLALGRTDLKSLEEGLKKGDRTMMGPTAPPQGLVLEHISY